MENVEFEHPEYVQQFLDRLPKGEPFKVKFLKQNGEPRELIGRLDPLGTTRKIAIPVMTEDGWKSFLVNRVLWIGKANPEE